MVKKREYKAKTESAMPAFDEMLEKVDLKKIRANINKLRTAIKIEEANRDGIAREGISDGYEQWRNGKYLYIYHLREDGKRDRFYVGNDKGKVKKALDDIDRYSVWEASCSRITNMEHRCKRLKTQFETITNNTNIEEEFESWYGF